MVEVSESEVHRYGGETIEHRVHDWPSLSVERTRWRVWDGTTGDSRPSQHLLFVTLSGTSGRVVAKTDDGSRYTGVDFSGAVTFVPAGCGRTAVYSGGTMEYAALRIDPPSAVSSREIDTDGIDLHPFTHRHDPLLFQLALSLFEQAEQQLFADQLFADAATALVTARLIQVAHPRKSLAAAPGQLGPRSLRRVTDYIQDNLGEDLRLSVLAGLCGLTTHQFLRAFKAVTGRTPHQYVIQQRMARAAELLRSSGELSIATVAKMVGMSSQSHLTTVFQKENGCTPAVYRAAYR